MVVGKWPHESFNLNHICWRSNMTQGLHYAEDFSWMYNSNTTNDHMQAKPLGLSVSNAGQIWGAGDSSNENLNEKSNDTTASRHNSVTGKYHEALHLGTSDGVPGGGGGKETFIWGPRCSMDPPSLFGGPSAHLLHKSKSKVAHGDSLHQHILQLVKRVVLREIQLIETVMQRNQPSATQMRHVLHRLQQAAL